MSFHLTAEDVRIDDNHILRAKLRNGAGELVDAEIDLDQCLGNADGMIQWDNRDFSQSCQNVHYAIEGGGQVPVLRCELRTEEGNWEARDVNLAERIENQDGRFVFT